MLTDLTNITRMESVKTQLSKEQSITQIAMIRYIILYIHKPTEVAGLLNSQTKFQRLVPRLRKWQICTISR